METINITSTEFRRNQSKFLDMATQGVSVIIKRGKSIFKLTPVESDRELDEDTLHQIEKSRKDYREGQCVKFSTQEDMHDYFDSL
jgi:antitoxin (DNA-binding transcriptional repressor) of toxin-antitoxin stability system